MLPKTVQIVCYTTSAFGVRYYALDKRFVKEPRTSRDVVGRMPLWMDGPIGGLCRLKTPRMPALTRLTSLQEKIVLYAMSWIAKVAAGYPLGRTRSKRALGKAQAQLTTGIAA